MDALAEFEDAAGGLADDGAVGVAEDVAFLISERPRLRQGVDGDEAFDEEVVELDEEAVFGAGEDGGVEVLADAGLHELDFFPLHELALGFVGAAFGLGGFEGDGGEFGYGEYELFVSHPSR